jgi:hypothetical protein
MSSGTEFSRDLPYNEYQAAVGANNPSASNVFATVSDLPPSINELTETGFAGSDDFVAVAEYQDIPGVYIEKKITADRLTYDSGGWKTIPVFNGSFGLANTGNPAYRPVIRVIGREVFMKGILILPMDNGAGSLDTGGASYPSNYRATLYQGVSNGGWTQAPQKQMNTRNPILPGALRPNINVVIGTNVSSARTVNPSIGDRVRLTTYLPNLSLSSGGILSFGTIDSEERNGITTTQYQKTSHFRKLASRFLQNDRIELYDNYLTSYNPVGPVLKEDNNASPSIWDFSCDATQGQDLGGFIILFDTSWELDISFKIEQIKAAWDAL